LGQKEQQEQIQSKTVITHCEKQQAS